MLPCSVVPLACDRKSRVNEHMLLAGDTAARERTSAMAELEGGRLNASSSCACLNTRFRLFLPRSGQEVRKEMSGEPKSMTDESEVAPTSDKGS